MTSHTAPDRPAPTPPLRGDEPLSQAQALGEIAKLMRIEHPHGPLLRSDIQAVLARVVPTDADATLERIVEVVQALPAEPVPLSESALAAWRTARSEALTDITAIITPTRA